MNFYYCLALIPIIILINRIFIKNFFLLNFAGELHQKFTSNKLTPLSGGFILIIFLFLNFPKELYDLLFFLSLFFILGFLADGNFIKSPSTRIMIQLIIILTMVINFNLTIDDVRIPYMNYLLQFEICESRYQNM